MNMFFFGTLRHLPLLEIVLGRAPGTIELSQDRLPGFSVDAVAEGPFPMLRSAPGADAPGVVAMGLTDQDRARLDYYEAGFHFDLMHCETARGVPVAVYKSDSPEWTPAGAWDFDGWVRQWAEMTEFAAREVMAGFGRVPPEEIARRFPRIRARAWSKVLAQRSRHGRGVFSGRIEMEHRAQAYAHFFALEDMRLRHERFDGAMSEPLERAIFVASDAAMILPYDPVRDRVLLVEQVRMGPVGRADPARWMLEPIAGFVDPGEQPEDAVRREAVEEAGLDIGEVIAVSEGYPSPGATTEYYHLFVGLCDLPDSAAGIGGAEEEGENIRSHLMGFDDVLAMAEDRRTGNLPLSLLVYWLAQHRARLRSA